MLLNCFKVLDTNEAGTIGGGLCQCSCSRKTDGTDVYIIGKAKSLEECSKVCLDNNWKLEKCDNINRKNEK